MTVLRPEPKDAIKTAVEQITIKNELWKKKKEKEQKTKNKRKNKDKEKGQKANNNEKYSTSFTCFKCDYPAEFRTAKELYNHEIMLHRDTRPRIECIICIPSEKYYTVEDLAKHISTSHDSASKSCPLCNCKMKKPYSAFKLANHMINCRQFYSLWIFRISMDTMVFCSLLKAKDLEVVCK